MKLVFLLLKEFYDIYFKIENVINSKNKFCMLYFLDVILFWGKGFGYIKVVRF